MDEVVPPRYIPPKMAFFTKVEDPESHLRRNECHLVQDVNGHLQWFNGIPDGHITSFSQFTRLFREQFSANKVKPPKLYDLFGVRQREGERLKEYLM